MNIKEIMKLNEKELRELLNKRIYIEDKKKILELLSVFPEEYIKGILICSKSSTVREFLAELINVYRTNMYRI